MKKIHYAWVVVLACALMFLCSMGITTTTFSIFFPYLRDINGFTNTQTSSLISVRICVNTIGMFLIDKTLRLLGPKKCAVYGTVVISVAFLLMGFAKAYWQYVIGAVLLGVGGAVSCLMVLTILINNWFISRNALAMSVASAGTGVCAVVISPAVTWIIENVSMRAAFLAVAAFLALITIIVAFLIYETPAGKGLEAYKVDVPEAHVTIKGGSGLGRKWTILFYISAFLQGFASYAASAQIANLYKTAGFDAFFVARLMSLYGIFLLAGKIIYGQLTDKKGGFVSTVLFLFLTIVGLSLNCLAGMLIPAVAVAGVSIMAFGLPVATIGIAVCIKSFYPIDEYNKWYRYYSVITNFGGIFSGLVPGLLADKTGSYVLAELMICICYIFILAIIAVIFKTQTNRDFT